MKIEWIDHRRPTEADSNDMGYVLTENGMVFWSHVGRGDRWIPVPEEPRSVKQVVDELADLTSGNKIPSSLMATAWYINLIEVVEELKTLTQENDE